MCAFYLAFCTSKKQAVRPDGTGHSLPPAAHISKRQGTAQLHKKNPSAGRIPRQAGRPSPVGHCVVGFCGTARGEWAWSVWAKNRSGRAVTCVSFPPSQRRAPFRGFHKGDTPLCALLVPFRASEKGPAGRGRIPRIPCRRQAAFFLKR